ncbi:MAG: ASKHA domain-containing protein [Phycisphaerae bacterium]
MPETTHHVTFEPEGRTVDVPDGWTLLEAAQAGGITLEAPCGGQGTCGGCRVAIPDRPPEPSEAARRILSGEERRRNLRLACQVRVRRDMRVVIPREARTRDEQILTETAAFEVPLIPNVRKRAVHVPEPSVADQRADADRLLEALADEGLDDLAIPTPLLREVPRRLRSLDFHPAVTVVGREVVHLDRPTATDACYGLALDVGTTTLVGYLVNLVTGEVAATASRANPQAAYGDDVIARIEYCGREKGGGRTLQTLVVDALNEILAEACRRAHVKPSVVYEATMVGNTTMNHLLLRLPVDAIARAPFVAVSASAHSVPARGIGLKMHRRGRLYTGPLVAGFVGADTVGVILATGMHASEGLRLAIDIGTNGEIVVGTRERLLACSTAAGPALEGARIRYGMRAATGAIDRVDIQDETVTVRTIGDAAPTGLCGTGLIDAVAAMLASGVLEPSGRMRPADDLAGAAPGLATRLRNADGETAFCLAEADEGGHDVLLTQRDVREVQLAKGAIAAGVASLLDEFGAALDDVEEVLLAGAFGNYIRPERARAIGLLPDVPLEKVRFVGNAAGAGARMLLVNKNLRHVAADVAKGVEHVELSRRPDFQTRFADAMVFPGG